MHRQCSDHTLHKQTAVQCIDSAYTAHTDGVAVQCVDSGCGSGTLHKTVMTVVDKVVTVNLYRKSIGLARTVCVHRI